MDISSKEAARPYSRHVVKATLKWFNYPKGFGFVVLDDGGADAFLHITTLQRNGVNVLGEGAVLLCLIDQTPLGATVADIVSVLDAGSEHQRIAGDGRSERKTYELTGVIKWYDRNKGYGFVTADDGGVDIFLHGKLLRRYGLDSIQPLVPVSMIVRPTQRGREVLDFEIIDEPCMAAAVL